ncbi:MAG: hypothetical protein K2H74_05850 [Paramuribaculum sp.]|nr:hypothetical protein [Paramuribaculum sp.]
MKRYVLLTIPASLLIYSCIDTATSSQSSQADSIAVTEPVVVDYEEDVTTPIVEEKSAWNYTESVDEMTDKTTYFATLTSENSVDFDFPYDGGSRLILTIRDSPQYGKDIYIKISKGQFNSSINGTNIKVRFDENEAFTVHCNEASDYSTDILFLSNYNKLLKNLKNSRTMKINVEFFSEGVRTFSFRTADLEWHH